MIRCWEPGLALILRLGQSTLQGHPVREKLGFLRTPLHKVVICVLGVLVQWTPERDLQDRFPRLRWFSKTLHTG